MAYVRELCLATLLALQLSSVVGLQLREESYPRVMYGFETCNQSWANAAMDMAFKTYLSDIPRENIVVSGGKHDDHEAGVTEERSPCEDHAMALACKEAVLLYRASTRMAKAGADWLVVTQEDKYINLPFMDDFFSKQNNSEPSVVSIFGCGQGWEFASKKDGMAKEKPSSWVDPEYSCDAVWQQGSICGGPGYAINRAALNKLHQSGQSMQEFVDDLLGSSKRNTNSDMATSCFLYKHGIPLKVSTMYSTMQVGQPEKKFERPTAEEVNDAKFPHALTYHLSVSPKETIPGLMLDLHNKFSGPSYTYGYAN